MYSATLLLFLTIPLILGSVISFVIFLAYPFIIAKRIKGEEMLLEKELDGYIEYKNGAYSFTPKGFFVSNYILAKILKFNN